MTRLTLTAWWRSISALAFQLSQLSNRANLFGEKGTEKGKFLFTDSGVPLPRPCTALAWASLCALGPSNGTYDSDTGEYNAYTLLSGNFVVPFLPKIRFGEDTAQSLIRTSKHHEKNSLGDIRWGKIYIADSSTGNLVTELQHGQISAVDWFRSQNSPKTQIHSWFHSLVPPLWAMSRSGWQFGVIQALPGHTMTLRDPMTSLARHGIPEIAAVESTTPQVRSLLIRFLETTKAQAWAKAYSESITPTSLALWEEDWHLLCDEIRKARIHEAEAQSRIDREASAKGLSIDADELMIQMGLV